MLSVSMAHYGLKALCSVTGIFKAWENVFAVISHELCKLIRLLTCPRFQNVQIGEASDSALYGELHLERFTLLCNRID